MKIFSYTFRTFPWKSQLLVQFPNLFIFESLKTSASIFEDMLLETQPDLVLGIARSNKKSYWESVTINQFNKSKKVIKGSMFESFQLDIPKSPAFEIRKSSTDSFCNWTMFKLASFIKLNKLDIQQSFIHICEEDLPNLVLD